MAVIKETIAFGRVRQKEVEAEFLFPLEKEQINEAVVRKTRFGGKFETVYRYVPDAPGSLLDYAHKVSQGKVEMGKYLEAVDSLKLLEAKREKSQIRKEKVSKVVNKVLFRGK